MRPQETTYGRLHADLNLGDDDHHAAPVSASIENTTQSIAASSAYNLDIDLGKTGLTFVRVQLRGPTVTGGGSGLWRECASVHVTASTSDAVGHSSRDAGSAYKVYSVTYSKAVGVTNLTHKIFDNVGGRYIALKDAVITGSTLRLTFHNYHPSSAQTLWVKGQAVAW